jgi:hypothetical protein
MIDIAKDLLDQGKIILPKIVTTSKSFEGEDIKEKSVNDITEEEMILDLNIEEETLSLIKLMQILSFGMALLEYLKMIFLLKEQDASQKLFQNQKLFH